MSTKKRVEEEEEEEEEDSEPVVIIKGRKGSIKIVSDSPAQQPQEVVVQAQTINQQTQQQQFVNQPQAVKDLSQPVHVNVHQSAASPASASPEMNQGAPVAQIQQTQMIQTTGFSATPASPQFSQQAPVTAATNAAEQEKGAQQVVVPAGVVLPQTSPATTQSVHSQQVPFKPADAQAAHLQQAPFKPSTAPIAQPAPHQTPQQPQIQQPDSPRPIVQQSVQQVTPKPVLQQQQQPAHQQPLQQSPVQQAIQKPVMQQAIVQQPVVPPAVAQQTQQKVTIPTIAGAPLTSSQEKSPRAASPGGGGEHPVLKQVLLKPAAALVLPEPIVLHPAPAEKPPAQPPAVEILDDFAWRQNQQEGAGAVQRPERQRGRLGQKWPPLQDEVSKDLGRVGAVRVQEPESWVQQESVTFAHCVPVAPWTKKEVSRIEAQWPPPENESFKESLSFEKTLKPQWPPVAEEEVPSQVYQKMALQQVHTQVGKQKIYFGSGGQIKPDEEEGAAGGQTYGVNEMVQQAQASCVPPKPAKVVQPPVPPKSTAQTQNAQLPAGVPKFAVQQKQPSQAQQQPPTQQQAQVQSPQAALHQRFPQVQSQGVRPQTTPQPQQVTPQRAAPQHVPFGKQPVQSPPAQPQAPPAQPQALAQFLQQQPQQTPQQQPQQKAQAQLQQQGQNVRFQSPSKPQAPSSTQQAAYQNGVPQANLQRQAFVR